MSTKSKLTFALLGATALFTLNPGLMPHVFFVSEPLSAEEISLDTSSATGLESLVGVPENGTTKTRAVNAALLPRDAGNMDTASLEAQPAVTNTVVPGANPFSATEMKVVPAAQTNALPAKIFEPAGAALSDQAIKSGANPFADPSASARKNTAANIDAPKSAKVDDAALRYYAASKDLKRLGSEMRRLKALYPDWQPPKDLFSPVANVSEQPLWDIYKTGDYAKVRAQIALMQSSNPRWVPSDDLLLKLQFGEARALINRAYAQGSWQQVISTAQSTPSLLVCNEMQVLWNVGESFARLRNYSQSYALYSYILSNCDDANLRLATIQKASLVLPAKGLTSLIALGRIMPDGTGEFDNIGFDGVRRQIGEYIQNGDFAATPSDEELKRFVDFVQRSRSGLDAALIGWYFYAQEDWKAANSWFIEAAQYERSPKNIEGVILTLRNMERPEDALKVARRYIKASPEIVEQYVEIISSSMTSDEPEIKLKDKELADFEKVVADNKSALGAQALGWKYLGEGDKEKAQDWFTDSVSWEPNEGGVVGLAVMAARAKNYKALSSLKGKYLKDYAALSDFKVYSSKPYKQKKKKVTASEVEKPKKTRRLFLFQSDNT